MSEIYKKGREGKEGKVGRREREHYSTHLRSHAPLTHPHTLRVLRSTSSNEGSMEREQGGEKYTQP